MDWKDVEGMMERVIQSETKTFTPVSDKLKVGMDLEIFGYVYGYCYVL